MTVYVNDLALSFLLETRETTLLRSGSDAFISDPFAEAQLLLLFTSANRADSRSENFSTAAASEWKPSFFSFLPSVSFQSRSRQCLLLAPLGWPSQVGRDVGR